MRSHFLIRHQRIWRVFLLACLNLYGNPPEDPRITLAQADRYADAGNWDAARPLYAEAEQGFAKRGDARNAQYAKFGRLHKDIETGSYADYLLRLEKDLSDPVVKSDPALRIRGLALKAMINMNLNTPAARRDWDEIAQLAAASGDKKWANRASGQLGLIAGVEGDYATALPRLLAAIATAESLKDLGAEVYFKTYFGNGLVVLGRAEQALPLYQTAIESIRKNPDSGYPIHPTIGKVRALTALNRREDARALIAEALEYSRKHEVLGAQTELLVQSGRVALDSGDLSAAESAFKEAVVTARRATLPRMVASAHSGLIDVYRAKQEWTAAENSADSAIQALQEVEEVYDLPDYLAKKASIEAQLGRTENADQLYEEATQIIEGMLVNMPSSLTKTSLIGTMSRVYTGHFRLAADQLRSTERAYSIIERARGRSLADSLRYGGRPDKSLSVWEIKIASIQQQIRRNRSPHRLKLLLADLEEAEANLSGVESERNRRALREMALLNTKATTLKGLQRALRQGETVLEYVLDEPHSYCLEITAGRATVHRLDGRKRIEDAVARYIAALRDRKEGAEHARYLYRELVGMASVNKSATVVVVPDGRLHLLPFAALIGPDSKYLVESMNLFAAPSGNVLHVLRSHRANGPRSRPFLGVGYSPTDIQDGDGPKVATRGLFDVVGAEFRPLAFAREEIAAAAEVTGADSVLLLGASASESSVKTAPLSDFRVLHFAAHAVESKKIPERAGLVLYPGSPSEDGLWQPREIRRESLRADLVVLSACETAVGKLEGQEGIANLARTFLVAGAKSVVASTWMVDDRTTATMMAQMYSYLGRGESVASALRHAQIDMLKQFGPTTPPFFWAGFMVVGDGSRTISFGSPKTDPRAAGRSLR